ncbi:MAG: glycosyltransferase family 2 protein [Thermodesulfobacteriota bacterium]|nr:glycosyltransferase family 2 protein [Thermodesulfobacteriota bacterium]
MPRVSIGLPVYNGEKYISEAIASLLKQTFPDFELIISDNASTDRTEEICRFFAERDPRIRYYHNETNFGAAWNFNRVYTLSSGEYFKWAAHDDLLDKTFLSKCVDVLENNSNVVLCHCMVRIINHSGRVMRDHKDHLTNLDSPYPHKRFFSLMHILHWCFDIFGLMRSHALKETPLIAPYFGSDRNLLVELSLKGKLHRIPEYLFFSREHSDRSIRKCESLRDRLTWFDPGLYQRVTLPVWRHFLEYFKSVSRVQLTFQENLACYIHLMRWFKWFWPFFKKDLMNAREQLKHPLNTTR